MDFAIFKILVHSYIVEIFTDANLRSFCSPICFCFFINSLVKTVVNVEGEKCVDFGIFQVLAGSYVVKSFIESNLR